MSKFTERNWNFANQHSIRKYEKKIIGGAWRANFVLHCNMSGNTFCGHTIDTTLHDTEQIPSVQDQRPPDYSAAKYMGNRPFSHFHRITYVLSRCHGQERSTWMILIGMYDDVIKWKHFPRYWPFVWGIHRSPVKSPHKGQWRGAVMFSLICVWING